MLKNIEISNFRTFRHLEMSDLPRVCLISGRNSVGKSTLLETIFFFYSSHRIDMLTRAQITRTHPLLPNTFLPSLFHAYDIRHDASLEITSDDSSIYENNYSFSKGDSPDNANLRNASGSVPDSVLTIKRYESALIISESNPRYSFLCTYAQKSEELKLYGDISTPKEKAIFFTAYGSSADTSASIPESSESLLSELLEKGRGVEAIDTIKKIVPAISNIFISVKDGQPKLMCNLEGVPQSVPLSHMGDGVLRSFNIILQTLIKQPDILLIDEIENGIHYSVLKILWKAIFENAREHKCQIFLTTHSYECIVAAVEAYNELQASAEENLFAFYRLENLGNDTIEAIRYAVENLDVAIDSEWEVR